MTVVKKARVRLRLDSVVNIVINRSSILSPVCSSIDVFIKFCWCGFLWRRRSLMFMGFMGGIMFWI